MKYSVLFLILILLNATKILAAPIVYTGWQSEETHNHITVFFFEPGKNYEKPVVKYSYSGKQVSKKGYVLVVQTQTQRIPDTPIYVHSARIDIPENEAEVHFVVGSEKYGFSSEYKVRTIKKDNESFRFVTGGDVGLSSHVPKLFAQAVKLFPQAVLLGGDIAYANGRTSNYKNWISFMKSYHQKMVDPEGYIIPLALAVGNHETNWSDEAPFFMGLFQQDQKTNFARHFKNHTGFYFLDTGHVQSHRSQSEWLDQVLNTNIKNKFAIYHVPLYPSVRSYSGSSSKKGRQYWAPYFDKHNLSAAFENHDHALKRTFPIKENKVEETGTIYFGDGCFGRTPRSSENRWYIQKNKDIRHFWLVESSSQGFSAKAVDINGDLLDQYRSY